MSAERLILASALPMLAGQKPGGDELGNPKEREASVHMDANELLQRIKQRSDFHQAGMILCHNGVVRATSRDGRKVRGLRVSVDREMLDRVLERHKARAGILEILVEINADTDLKVGDDVMYLVVAGDIRENVIATLADTLDAIKSTVTQKTEFFV